LSDSLERLSARDWSTIAPSRTKAPRTRTQRPFAEVGDAVVHVLREAGHEMQMVEVHAAVEDLLSEPVSRSSAKNYLARGCRRGRSRLFERVGHGCYRLVT
jgi:hypothetical protein